MTNSYSFRELIIQADYFILFQTILFWVVNAKGYREDAPYIKGDYKIMKVRVDGSLQESTVILTQTKTDKIFQF